MITKYKLFCESLKNRISADNSLPNDINKIIE